MIFTDPNLINALKEGKVAVIPTDTIYGIVGSALDESLVNRIYDIRKRAPEKPCIILIGDMMELEKFSVNLSAKQKEKIKEYWPFAFAQDLRPVPTSMVLDCPGEKFAYLHRGTETLAFRIPPQEELRSLLKETGPLIAPSANPEGLPPAKNIEEARNYFGDAVDFYADGGEIEGKASRVIRLYKNNTTSILRE
jgi:L-threonylcarbamoyladenylate synthase